MKVTGSIFIRCVEVEVNKMNLNKSKYIFEYIEHKTKFCIKKFECRECQQLFIYIVPIKTHDIKCCTCNAELIVIEN